MSKRQGWLRAAAVEVKLDEVNTLSATPKLFSTGSRGWYYSGKIELGGERVQVSLSLVVCGSATEDNPLPQLDKKSVPDGKAPERPQKPLRLKKAPKPVSAPPEPSGTILDDGTPLLDVCDEVKPT